MYLSINVFLALASRPLDSGPLTSRAEGYPGPESLSWPPELASRSLAGLPTPDLPSRRILSSRIRILASRAGLPTSASRPLAAQAEGYPAPECLSWPPELWLDSRRLTSRADGLGVALLRCHLNKV